MKSGRLSHLEPSGLVQGCNGNALAFTAAAQFCVSDRLHCNDYTVHQGRPNFTGKGRQSLLWTCSWAARLNITKGGEPNLLN